MSISRLWADKPHNRHDDVSWVGRRNLYQADGKPHVKVYH